MWQYIILDFVTNPEKVGIALLLLVFAFLFLYISKTNISMSGKIIAMYLHLFFLLSPFIFLAVSWGCQMALSSCVAKQILLIGLPSTVFISFLIGFFILPFVYKHIHKSRKVKDPYLNAFIEMYAAQLNIKSPDLFYIESAKPSAHSFTNMKPMIFISVLLRMKKK